MKGIRQRAVQFLPAAAVIAAAAVVFPGTADAFELPKRIVWGALAAAMAACAATGRGAARGRGTGGLRSVFGWALLAWMFARSGTRCLFPGWSVPLLSWATPLALFLIGSAWAAPCKAVRNLERAVVWLGVAEAALMLLQRFGLDPVFGEATRSIAYGPGRMIGTVGYQNQAAEFLGVALCAATARWRSLRGCAAAAVMLAAIALTGNRGAIAGLAAVALVAAAVRLIGRLRGRQRAKTARPRAGLLRAVAVFGVAVAVAGAMVAMPQTRGRFAELANPERSVSVRSRAWMARVALSLWRDNPVFGAGAGAYGREYIDRLGALLPQKKEHSLLGALVWAREAHCDPLQFAAEFGIVGVALMAGFAATLVLGIRRRNAVCAGGALRATAFLSVCSLFSFSWQTSFAAPVVALLLASALAWRSSEASDAAARPSPFSPFRKAIALAVAAWMLVAGLGENLSSAMLGNSVWDLASGEMPLACSGEWRLRAAAELVRAGFYSAAAQTFGEAVDEGTPVSPGALAGAGAACLKCGRFPDALQSARRLAASGLMHDEALKLESKAFEKLGRFAEAADVEAERFRLWEREFSDGELFRLAALSLMGRNAERAEWLARRFFERCETRGEPEKWTPQWENLRGGAFLALGRREEARNCFAEALRRDPSLHSARRNLQSMQ